MQALLAIRPLFFGLFLVAVASMAFAFYLEHALALEPCPLCMTQRLFVVLVGLFGLLGALHNPQGWGRRVYGFLCLLAAITGGAVAARHIWLQSLPEELAPACGPSLEYMLETLPLSETFTVIMIPVRGFIASSSGHHCRQVDCYMAQGAVRATEGEQGRAIA